MAITDSGIPTTSPHTMLSNLLTNNMTSPDGVWTPVVNPNWLEFKKQKTFQIAILPLATNTEIAQLTGNTSTAMPTYVTSYYAITLYAPTRAKIWLLYQKVMLVLNNTTLTSPTAGINDYHWVRVSGVGGANGIIKQDTATGIDKDESEVVKFQMEITVAVRWNE